MTLSGTDHFSLREILDASAPATLADLARVEPNIRRTLDRMERIRALLGNRPITLTSFFRTGEENATLPNASRTSDHMNGLAVDFRVKGLTPEAVMMHLHPHLKALGVDQIIRYGTHVHVGFGYRERGQASIFVASGTPLLPWTAGAQAFPIAPAPASVPVTAPSPQPKPTGNGGAALAVLFALALGALAYSYR